MDFDRFQRLPSAPRLATLRVALHAVNCYVSTLHETPQPCVGEKLMEGSIIGTFDAPDEHYQEAAGVLLTELAPMLEDPPNAQRFVACFLHWFDRTVQDRIETDTARRALQSRRP